MNVRDAILKAADHIENNPRLFNYMSNGVPSCGTPGCAIGWIGHFADLPQRNIEYLNLNKVALRTVGIPFFEGFVERMDELGHAKWRNDAIQCATVLRLYADKYHPADAAPRLDPAFTAWRDALKVEHGFTVAA